MVELEDVEIIVVPVFDEITEAIVFLGLAHTIHFYLVRLLLQGQIGEEVISHRLRYLLAIAVVECHLVGARCVTVPVDAEAKQGVVAHCPELLLVSEPFLACRTKHLDDVVHLDIVSRHVARSRLNLCPPQARVGVLYLVEVCHVGDVVGKIKVEIRLLSLDAAQP